MMDLLRVQFLNIATRLRERGTALRPPASEDSIRDLERVLESRLSNSAAALYSTFDGFEDGIPDGATMVCLWSIENIRDSIESGKTTTFAPIIGDYFIMAECFTCDLGKDDARVLWAERNEVASTNLLEFCRLIAEGTFSLK